MNTSLLEKLLFRSGLCTLWLKQKNVSKAVNSFDVGKTPPYIAEIVFGADGPKRNAKYLTVALQYALDAGYCPGESVEKL